MNHTPKVGSGTAPMSHESLGVWAATLHEGSSHLRERTSNALFIFISLNQELSTVRFRDSWLESVEVDALRDLSDVGVDSDQKFECLEGISSLIDSEHWKPLEKRH